MDHLYAHLTRKGILTFKDDERLEKGDSLSPQLLQAIQNSKISIVVFSKRYAESTWCLEEMATIVECRKAFGQTVFPVFYDVPPSHVRRHGGAFGDAYASLFKKFKNQPMKIFRWQQAMAQMSYLVGFDVRDK